MFDRFRKTSRSSRAREGAVAVEEHERELTTAAPQDDPDDRRTTVVERERVMRERDEPATTTQPAEGRTVDNRDLDDGPRLRRTVDDRDVDDVAERPTRADRDLDDVAERPTRADRDLDDPAERRGRVARRDVDDDSERRRTLAPVVGDATLAAMHDRQRVRFGGIRWGSAFFGLLSAIGLAAMLLSIVAAAGVTIGVSQIEDVTTGDADTIGLGGAILVLAVLALSWFCGGYVAGRMARFDGMRQGIGVWVWTLVIGLALAIAAIIGGSEYDVFAQLNLPNIAVGDQTLTTGGAITLAAALVVTLIAAIAGGKVGDRFHRRVDRFAAREYVQAP
jgi:hypothetical protein